jgi:hypothetical protein
VELELGSEEKIMGKKRVLGFFSIKQRQVQTETTEPHYHLEVSSRKTRLKKLAQGFQYLHKVVKLTPDSRIMRVLFKDRIEPLKNEFSQTHTALTETIGEDQSQENLSKIARHFRSLPSAHSHRKYGIEVMIRK